MRHGTTKPRRFSQNRPRAIAQACRPALKIHPESIHRPHLFVLWVFHKSEGYDLEGTPPSDNRPHGVFATRSPRRPNPIGLSVVELLRREDALLHLRRVDMLDGTPVLDIKPYLSGIPQEELRRGWLAEAEARSRRFTNDN